MLALGIGGSAAVFSLVRAVFLTPLPFPESDRLVAIAERRGGSRDANIPVSGHEYAAWKERSDAFEQLALSRGELLNLTGVGEPESVRVLRTSAEYFDVLQFRPVLGRAFAPGEDQSGGARVAILSNEFWRRRFGADASILERTITLNDQAFGVVGVLPPLPESLSGDIWLPIDLPGHLRAVGRHNLHVVGKLKHGVSVEHAASQLQAVSQQLAREMPNDNTDHNVHLVNLRESLVGEFRVALLVLLGAVGCVLLIACANLANLLLTRGAARRREIAVRVAIGASRARIVRGLIVESVALAVLGGGAGVIIAAWVVDLMPAFVAVDIPLMDTARIDPEAFVLSAVLSLICGVAIAFAPALSVTRPDVNRYLAATQQPAGDRSGQKLRSFLVASQVAWTLILLVGAGLMLNTLVRLLYVDTGFNPSQVAVFTVDLPGGRYADAGRRLGFYDDVLERLRGVPGVLSVGGVSHLPLGGRDNWMPFTVVGRPPSGPGQEPYAAFRVSTPDYFQTLGIPLRAGRFFGEPDRRVSIPVIRWFPEQPLPADAHRPQAAPVVVISEAAARQFWPGEDAIGKRIRVLFSPEMTVVGIVGDVKHNALNQPAYPHIYLPHHQEPWGSVTFVVRVTGDPASVSGMLRDRVRAVDADISVTVRAMDEMRSDAMTYQRFYFFLIGLFGGVALVLAIIGIAAVVSFAAAQRRTEIGVRLALGAQPGEILRMMVVQALPPIVSGVAAGIGGALALTGFLETLLYGVEPADPLTFAIVAIVLAAVATAACWLPARRVAHLDPVIALRVE
jgi:putative ABC transport system permease protein